jgi:glutathione S-transferase
LEPSLPFGQLPYLEDGDVKFAQSGAIIRYVAKKGGLDGDNLADFAKSEMLIEEMQDINTLFVKAMYAPEGRVEGFQKLFAADSSLHYQLSCLEKLLTGDSFCSKPLAGDCK